MPAGCWGQFPWRPLPGLWMAILSWSFLSVHRCSRWLLLWLFSSFYRNTGQIGHQCFGHLMWRTDSLEKTLMLGKTEGGRRRGRQRMRRLDGITDSMDMNLSKLRQTEEDKGAWCAAAHGVTKSWTWLRNRTEVRLDEGPSSQTFLLWLKYSWFIMC